MSAVRGFRRNPEDVADDILIEENYSAIRKAIDGAVGAYSAGRQESERRACQMFLTELMNGGFYVNYRPPLTKDNLKTGRIKFYNPDKGYAFVLPDDGSKDVFASDRLLRAANLVVVRGSGDKVTKTVMIQEGTPVEYMTAVTGNDRLGASWIRIRQDWSI